MAGPGFRFIPHAGMLAPLLLAPALAFAAPIGAAITVKPAASLESATGTALLARGGAVESNDRVVTGPEGATRLRFLDASTLDVGPGANVTLDEFIYTGNKASKAALTMTKGAFRWVSGNSPKEAYDIRTPLATIGIRGTDFRVTTDEGVTVIRLASGAVTSCSRVSQTCASIDRPGQGVRLFADGRVEMFMEDPATPPTRRAAAPPPVPPRASPPPRRQASAPPRRTVAPQEARRIVYVDEPPPRMARPQRRPRPPVVYEDDYADQAPPPRVQTPPWVVTDGGWNRPRPPRWPRPDGGHRPPRGDGDGGKPPGRGGGTIGFGFGMNFGGSMGYRPSRGNDMQVR